MEAARDQLTTAGGVLPDPDTPVDLLAVIGRAVLDNLLPPRRPRYSARKVKSATSRYLHRDDGRPRQATTITTIDITMRIPPIDQGPKRTSRYRSAPSHSPQPPTRRDRVTEIMNTDPRHGWSGRELAERLKITPRNLLTQLAEWSRLGFLTRTGPGTYALPEPP